MSHLIRQFNQKYNEAPDMIAKALTSATGVGEALIPENLEQLITDTIIRLSPEMALLIKKKISGKTHKFNRLTQKPGRGGAIGENGSTPVTGSKLTRDEIELKIVRRKGKVTDFLSDTSEDYIDAPAFEMENHLQSHVLDLIYYLIWGNAAMNQYEFSGLEQFITSNRVAYSASAGGAVPTTLTFLDTMIDASNRKGGARHNRVIEMSPEMLSKVSSLLSNVRLNQGLAQGGLTQVDIAGGWRLNAYRDIPIVESTSLSPVEALSSTVTITGGGSGGTIADGDYFIYVSPVTNQGEQAPSAEKTVTLSGGGDNTITVELDAPHQTDDNGTLVDSAYKYKIYIGTATGSENCTLIKEVPAFTYDADGAPTGDNMIVTTSPVVLTTLTPGADVPTHMQADFPLTAVGGKYAENIIMWDLDPIQGLGKFPYTNSAGDKFEGLVTTKQLAPQDDWLEFLVKTYACLTPAFESSSYWLRNIRAA